MQRLSFLESVNRPRTNQDIVTSLRSKKSSEDTKKKKKKLRLDFLEDASDYTINFVKEALKDIRDTGAAITDTMSFPIRLGAANLASTGSAIKDLKEGKNIKDSLESAKLSGLKVLGAPTIYETLRGEEIKDTGDMLGFAGAAAEAPTYLYGGGAVKNLAANSAKQALGRTIFQGVKSGLAEGALTGITQTMRSDEYDNPLAYLRGAATGGAIGGAFGGAVSGAGVAIDVTRANKILNMMDNADITGNVTKWMPDKVVKEAKNYIKQSMRYGDFETVAKSLGENVNAKDVGEVVYKRIDELGPRKLKRVLKEVVTNQNARPVGETAGAIAQDFETAKILRGTKGMTADDIVKKYPNIQLKRDVPATDIHGNKVQIPESEKLTPYELKGNKILLQDGETYIVSKSQFQNIKGNSVEAIGKPFAPELDELDESVRRIQNTADGNTWSDYHQKLIRKYQPQEGETLAQYATREEMAKLNSLEPIKNVKYDQYTLPGGKENYREILIKDNKNVPKEYISKEMEKYIIEPYGDNKFVIYEGGYPKDGGREVAGGAVFNSRKEAENEIVQEIMDNADFAFKGPHWSDPNVVSHLRMNDRTFNGKKVAFMEELQSDWAKAGRERGFIEDSMIKELPKDTTQIIKNGPDEINPGKWSTFELVEEGDHKTWIGRGEYNTKEEAEKGLLDYINKRDARGIPGSPHLKNWQETSVRRALKDAVDSDAEYFAWISGDQTSARYNLSKQLESVSWSPVEKYGELPHAKSIEMRPRRSDGGIPANIQIDIDNSGRIVNTDRYSSQWIGKKLDEVVGKGMADKIMSKQTGELSGEGLKFGGEWANNLYDKQVPNIVKKLTGADVEVIKLKTGPGRAGRAVMIETSPIKNQIEAFNIGSLTEDEIQRIARNNNLKVTIKDGKVASLHEVIDVDADQMAIKLTPEIKAKIRGEAPEIKTSGKMFGVQPGDKEIAEGYVTPFRGKPFSPDKETTEAISKSLTEQDKYYYTPRAKGFENDVKYFSESYNVKVKNQVQVDGYYEGASEPSYKIDIAGTADDNDKFIASLAKSRGRDAQDSAIKFVADNNGTNTRYIFDGNWTREEAHALVHQSGITGATLDKSGKKIILIDAWSDDLSDLNKLKGITNVEPTAAKGNATVFVKNSEVAEWVGNAPTKLYDEVVGGGRGVLRQSSKEVAQNAPAPKVKVNYFQDQVKKGVKEAPKVKVKYFDEQLAKEVKKTTEENTKTALEKVQTAIRTAKTELGKKTQEISAERAKRFAMLENIGEGGEEGLNKRLKALEGSLSDRNLGDTLSKNLTQDEVDGLIDTALNHPALTGIERTAVARDMREFIKDGKIPGKQALNMMENVYGTEFVSTLKKALNPKQVALENIIDVTNIPRTLMASFDMSAPFRQGIVLMARHPVKSLKSAKTMFKAFASEDAYEQAARAIIDNKNYALAKNAGVEFTEYGKGVLNNREESFVSKLAEKVPIVRNSERAYTAYLNKMRMDVFSDLSDKYKTLGYDITKDAKIFNDLAGFVNRATGRGPLPKMLQGSSELLNGLFFSPKLVASRVSLLNPAYYAKLSAPVRKEAMKTMATFVGAGLAVLGLAKLAGAEVEDDWRSADFGKIKVGKTRYDIWGGFQQYVKLLGQMVTGESKSTTTGRVSKLNSGEYGARTRWDVLGDFMESKASPPTGAVINALKGETATGAKTSVLPTREYEGELVGRITPMVWQDAYEAFKEEGLVQGTLTGTAAFFGVGTQTYKRRKSGKKSYLLRNTK